MCVCVCVCVCVWLRKSGKSRRLYNKDIGEAATIYVLNHQGQQFTLCLNRVEVWKLVSVQLFIRWVPESCYGQRLEIQQLCRGRELLWQNEMAEGHGQLSFRCYPLVRDNLGRKAGTLHQQYGQHWIETDYA